MLRGTNFTHNPKRREYSSLGCGNYPLRAFQYILYVFSDCCGPFVNERKFGEGDSKIYSCKPATNKNILHRIYSIRKFNKSKLHSIHTFAYFAQSMSSLFLLLLFLVLHMGDMYLFASRVNQATMPHTHTHIRWLLR